jgi:hypothetical protein
LFSFEGVEVEAETEKKATSNLSLGGCIFAPGNNESPKYYNINPIPSCCKMPHGDYVKVWFR